MQNVIHACSEHSFPMSWTLENVLVLMVKDLRLGFISTKNIRHAGGNEARFRQLFKTSA